MNLALLDAFAAVMQTGSTTRAAELLGISQPAVSRALMRLEDTTRLKLFERSGPRLVPTLEAELLFRELNAAQIGLDRLRQAVVRLREVGSGSLRIASSAALGLTFVPQAINRFLRKRPAVSITFEIAGSSRVRDLVSSGVFDVGLCADEIDTSNLITEHFAAGVGVCVMRKEHRLATKDIIVPEDLNEERLVALAPEDRARKQIEAVFSTAGVSPRIAVETQFSATVSQLVQEGVGVGIVNSLSLFSSEVAYPDILARRLKPAVEFNVLLVSSPQRARSQVSEDFVQSLSTERDNLLRLCAERLGS